MCIFKIRFKLTNSTLKFKLHCRLLRGQPIHILVKQADTFFFSNEDWLLPSTLPCKEIIFVLVIHATELREKRKKFRDYPKDSHPVFAPLH